MDDGVIKMFPEEKEKTPTRDKQENHYYLDMFTTYDEAANFCIDMYSKFDKDLYFVGNQSIIFAEGYYRAMISIFLNKGKLDVPRSKT